MEIFRDAPSQTQSVKGAGATPDLVQYDQTAGSGVVQNRCRFAHLYHKGGLSAGDIVTGADTGEDAVHDIHTGLFCRDE